MQSFGNMAKLKEAIKSKYDGEIAELEKQTQQQLNAIEAETKREAQHAASRIKMQAKREAAQAGSKVFSEEKLKAKKAFESAREQLIGQVFAKVRADMPKVAHSRRYMAFVKKKMDEAGLKKGLSVIADGPHYKALGRYTKQQGIVGVKLVSGELTYDLTLSTAFDSKKDELRLEASEVFFGE